MYLAGKRCWNLDVTDVGYVCSFNSKLNSILWELTTLSFKS